MIQYLITDPKYYTNIPHIFEERLTFILKKHPVNIACFRDKKSPNFEELAELFVKVCRKEQIENIFINTDYKLAKKLGAKGVHLTSSQFDKIKEVKSLNLDIIISCHNSKELENAKNAEVKTVTYSPVFNTPNKGTPKGISQLKEIIEAFKELNIIALGGIISNNHLEEIQKTKAYGFASIRYFTENISNS